MGAINTITYILVYLILIILLLRIIVRQIRTFVRHRRISGMMDSHKYCANCKYMDGRWCQCPDAQYDDIDPVSGEIMSYPRGESLYCKDVIGTSFCYWRRGI
jgi:hypothetical protein